MHEARRIEVESAGGVFPACIEHERVDGFAVAHAGVALKDHHEGDDARGDGAASGACEQVGEGFVGKKLVGACGEKPKDRGRRQTRLAELAGGTEEILMLRGAADGHARYDEARERSSGGGRLRPRQGKN